MFQYFMERVKDHEYVAQNEETKPLIIETLTFLYDLDMINTRNNEVNKNSCSIQANYKHKYYHFVDPHSCISSTQDTTRNHTSNWRME